jgi:hypothetical protein
LQIDGAAVWQLFAYTRKGRPRSLLPSKVELAPGQ